jgi:hypothetical protein
MRSSRDWAGSRSAWLSSGRITAARACGVRRVELAGATPFAPRTRRDVIEERLFARRRDLCTDLSLVFFDTTSIYFEGAGGDMIGHDGHSKDHRPDRKQMVVGMVLDLEGRPLCCEIWPGNTTDVKSLNPIVDRLRTRFHLGRVCIVADRGMISRAVIDEIKTREDWWYILGVRMRTVKAMRALLAADDGPYEEVFPRTRDTKRPAPLQVRAVTVEDRDYVLCLNEDEATKDWHDREAIASGRHGARREQGVPPVPEEHGPSIRRRRGEGAGRRALRREVGTDDEHGARRTDHGPGVQTPADGREYLSFDEERARNASRVSHMR